jgi:hypothetical protein
VCFCGSVFVNVGEDRFRDVLVTTSHAIVGRLVNLAEICGGHGKAPIKDSHEVLDALVEGRLLLHTSCRHEWRARVLAPQRNSGLGEGIGVGLRGVERHFSLWSLVCGQEETGCRT